MSDFGFVVSRAAVQHLLLLAVVLVMTFQAYPFTAGVCRRKTDGSW
jgi:hypothetical protein